MRDKPGYHAFGSAAVHAISAFSSIISGADVTVVAGDFFLDPEQTWGVDGLPDGPTIQSCSSVALKVDISHARSARSKLLAAIAE
jgi:hypothetical protein